ncbi:MAG: ABC transporter permease [Moraxellaceae bacterium]|nr:MAG: ABC transporter permease [Moraxellaceae bacterium]
MTASSLIRLSLRLLSREWRAGSLTVMVCALLIAIASHTTIGFFTERLSAAMEAKAKHLLGADLVFKSPTEINPALLLNANTAHIQSAKTVEFTTVAVAGETLKLSSIKAVSSNYPLKGFLRTSTGLSTTDNITTESPSAGELWVESRVLSSLNINVGDSIDIGDASLTVTRLLTLEPDRSGAFYAFTPRILMSLEDLPKTNVVQFGSRIDYRYLFVGGLSSIETYKNWLTPQLTPGQKLLDIHSERPTVSSYLTRADSYMNLAGLVAILLAAVAIAMSARLYAESHFDTSAMLRCLGGKQNDILILFIIQLSVLAIFSGVLGAAIGWCTQSVIAFIIKDMLPEIFPAASMRPVWSGIGLSFIVLFGFSLPTLIRLRQVSPLRVLRKNLEPKSLPATLIYTTTFIFVCLLIFAYTQNIALTIATLTGGTSIALFGYLIVTLLFRILNRINVHLPLELKSGIRNLTRREAETRWQTFAFGITLMAMALVIMIRTDLIDTWQSQLPEDVPNHFIMNIQLADVEPLKRFFVDQGIDTNQLYPVSRGRLTHINSTPVKQAVTKEEKSNEALNRELNLTESANIQLDNRIIEGSWWEQTNTLTVPRVSVEARLAKKLDIKMHDSLTFFIGSKTLEARVSSIRTVKWDSFKPNFYMIFEPNSLKGFPITHITSFYLPVENRATLNSLLKKFPAITLLEVDAILEQIKSILKQVSIAVEIVLSFVLLAGFAVTFAALQSTMSQRLQEGALMRTLGASRRQIRLNQWVEYAMMGSLSGLLAYVGTEVVLWATYTKIFKLEYDIHFGLMVLLPLVGTLVIGLFGAFSSRKVLKESPMMVLREVG